MTDEVILPTLAIEHPNMTGAANEFNLTFDVTGGTTTGMWCLVIGSRRVVPSGTPGRVQDTFGVFYADTSDTRTAAQKITGAMQTLEQAFWYAVGPESPPAYLVERYMSEQRTRRAQIFSGTIAYADGIPGWELYKGAREAVITVEREAVWQGELLVSTLGNLSNPDDEELTASARILDRGTHINGNRLGAVEMLRIRPGSSTTTLRQVFVGFKDAGRVGLNVGFDPHIDVARGVAGANTGVGRKNSIIVTDSSYWRGRALRIQFDRNGTDESAFSIRQQIPYAEWNDVATAANYPKMAGRYRLVGQVYWANPSEATTYKLQAGLAWGAYTQGRAGISWLNEIWRVMSGSGESSTQELVDFGEVVLPFPQSTMSEWNRTDGALNPLIVIGAGLIDGDAVGGMIRMDKLVLVPAQNYIYMNWPGGVSGDYHYRVYGGADGSAVVYTSNKTGTSLAAPGKQKEPDNWRPPWGELDYDEAAAYSTAVAAESSGGFWSQVTDVTVSEGGLYAPFSSKSAVVAVATGPCHLTLYNRVRVAT